MDAAKRIFVIIGHTAAITPNFTLDDLPGSAGRLDILARCVTAAFCLSHGIRRDVEVRLVLRDRVVVRFEGGKLKRLNPDERSTGGLIRHALIALQREERQSTPGTSIVQWDLKGVLADLAARRISCYVLDEHGRDIRGVELEEPCAFVLSDHRNLTPHEAALLEGLERLSLGPQVLHADHCIPLVHNELDRREASQALE